MNKPRKPNIPNKPEKKNKSYFSLSNWGYCPIQTGLVNYQDNYVVSDIFPKIKQDAISWLKKQVETGEIDPDSDAQLCNVDDWSNFDAELAVDFNYRDLYLAFEVENSKYNEELEEWERKMREKQKDIKQYELDLSAYYEFKHNELKTKMKEDLELVNVT